jgi:hypothetical protein
MALWNGGRAGAHALVALGCLVAAAGAPRFAAAHGFAGKRFFPSTPTIDDPFVADELSAPTVTQRKLGASGDAPETLETDTTLELSKRITRDLGFGFAATQIRLRPDGGEVGSGLDNVAASLKYQFYRSDAHEAVASAGVDWDIGGTGSKRVGAESFSTVTPTLFFGRGLGDLPDSARFLRPIAITGLAGVAIPSRASSTSPAEDGSLEVERHPDVLTAGFAFEYSIPYLQSAVKDVGLRDPFSRMIPLVELSLQKPLDRGGGSTLGTVNPGVIWAGRYYQLALEAVIPANGATGGKTGVLFQVHFFLDDLFPRSLGRPLWGDER